MTILRTDTLPYRKPELGKHYWIKDNILPDPFPVVERCLNKTEWTMGAPWRPEPWPGMRAPDALRPEELAVVEDWVKSQIGVRALRPQDAPVDGVSGHNHVQIVGGGDAVARPHVDSSKLCDYAGVLYLHPYPPTKHAGTSFYRLRLPDGTPGGNICPPPYESLSQIPSFEKGSDLSMWEEDIEVPYVFNRLLVYKSDIVHSATAYFGWDHELGSKRIAVVFFLEDRVVMIDLRSDTVTKPSPAMREAMAQAEVGDDVFGEDPTVNRLQDVAARLLGKEAALFVPSGTMGNQLSVRLHTKPGDEIVVEAGAHVVRYESGAAAGLSGVQTCWLPGTRGILEVDQIEAAIRPPDYHNPPTTLISLENTHNRGGGTIYPLDTIKAIRKMAEARGIAMHLDGARLFNAVVATGVPAAEYARHFETVTFCLSKGLGAPVGSLICADRERVVKLRRLRKMFGGGMRQAGIIAAAGLYALERNIARLAEDHAHAKRLAAALAGMPGVRINPAHVETNIVVFDISETRRTAAEVLALLKAEELLLVPFSPTTLRAVTHLDVSRDQIEQACAILKKVFTT